MKTGKHLDRTKSTQKTLKLSDEATCHEACDFLPDCLQSTITPTPKVSGCNKCGHTGG